MGATIRINMNPAASIIAKRKLQNNGPAQVLFTKECAKAFNNYVPLDTGRLKDMMITIETARIIYSAPYASKQFYNNKGMGKQGDAAGGKRGKQWASRGWIDNGNKIVQTIANFCGGSSE